MVKSNKYLFCDSEYGRQWGHREGEGDDARIYDAQIRRAMNLEVGRDDTWSKQNKKHVR